VDLLEKAYQNAGAAELFAHISYAEGRTYMHDVLLRDTDQMSMAHALEVRVPLLDPSEAGGLRRRRGKGLMAVLHQRIA
jgi:hypothetical protein